MKKRFRLFLDILGTIGIILAVIGIGILLYKILM